MVQSSRERRTQRIGLRAGAARVAAGQVRDGGDEAVGLRGVARDEGGRSSHRRCVADVLRALRALRMHAASDSMLCTDVRMGRHTGRGWYNAGPCGLRMQPERIFTVAM